MRTANGRPYSKGGSWFVKSGRLIIAPTGVTEVPSKRAAKGVGPYSVDGTCFDERRMLWKKKLLL